MKTFDVLIIGSGFLSDLMAAQLQKEGKSSAVITSPNDPETAHLHEILAAKADFPLNREKLNRALAMAAPEVDPRPVKYPGPGKFTDKHIFATADDAFHAKKFIISTGALRPSFALNTSGSTAIKTPFEILTTPQPIASLIIFGAGPTAAVLAQKQAQNGTQVRLVTGDSQLLDTEDSETRNGLKAILEKEGVQITSELPTMISADAVCFAGEAVPNTDGLGLDSAGVYVNKAKAVVVNEECRTSAPHIWAVGSVTGPPFEPALYRRQAEIAVENICGFFLLKSKLDFDPIPFTVPSFPPFSRVGLTENGAREIFGQDVATITYPLQSNERAVMEGHHEGWIKIVGRKKGAELFGAQILAPHAEEMILFFDLVLRANIPLTEFSEQNHFPFGSYGAAIYQSIKAFNDSNA